MARVMLGPLSFLSLGVLVGATVGLLGGVAEVSLRPLEEPLRIPYVLGANGLLGAAWGLLATVLRWRGRGDPARATASIVALVVFPALAVGAGIFANEVLLEGENFLSPVSLVADTVALALAAAIALAISAGTRRVLASRGRVPSVPPASAGVVLIALVAACALPLRVVASRAGTGPDLVPIVLISIDTLRPDCLSGGGEPLPTSPEIDRLCREGILWPFAVTASPGSAAAHAALLTSRYPVSNGVWANFSILDASVETFAERLRAAGYRAGGFVTNTFLGRRFGFAQGFDAYVESGVTELLAEPSGAALFRSLALVQIVDKVRYRINPGYDPSFETALSWLRESDHPPFLFLHLMDPHSPYVPPHPWGDRFGATADGGPESPDHRNRFGWRPSIKSYLAEVRHLDSKLGRLRRELETLGLLDECILVLTSDHGENLVDHVPNFTHGSTIHESVLRILVALRAPDRVETGVVDPRVLENVDVIPTIAALAGLEPLPLWAGRSFAAEPVPELTTTFGQINRDFAVRTKEWKVIVRADGTRDVYHLDSDPGEIRPLASTPELLAQAEDALAAWLLERSTLLYTEQARSVRPEELSPAIRDRLRALGYLD
jgi:arylsulfatase A-like enzyme